MKYNLCLIKRIFLVVALSISTIIEAAPNVWDVLRSELNISHEVTRPEVQEQIRWLAAHPSFVQKVCRQSEPYIYHILAEIKKRKLPGELALLPMLESAYDPFAYSGVGAAGLWQLMPRTGSDLGLKQDWWFDARRSIRPSTNAALNYLVYLNKFFSGNWLLAIAAYDSGEGTIARAIKNNQAARQATSFWNLPVPRETKVYVPRLLALAELIKNPSRYKVELPVIPYLPYFEEVDIGSQIDLNHAAKLAGISYKELIKLNPGYNRWTTAPYKPFKLLIPKTKVAHFNLNLANVPEENRVSWTRYQVKPGENLQQIAAKNHTNVHLIKQLNQLKTNGVKTNQSILIPNAKNKTLVITPQAPSENTLALSIPKTRRIIHIVQARESYKTIQALYGVSSKEIQTWNKLPVSAPLHSGQQLVILKKTKAPSVYQVKSGDSLSLIASQHQTKIEQLLSLNPTINRSKPLKIGQKIWIG